MDGDDTLLEIRGLTKNFPGVQALKNVDFILKKGEIHALMGENGAGKSTLIKCLTGVHKRDAGTIAYDGNPIDCANPLKAQGLGISSVYQEVNLVPNLSVAENLLLGRQPMKGGQIAWRVLNMRAKEIVGKFDLNIAVEADLGEYPVAVQQMVAIARALEVDSRILILDEPTSSLNLLEAERLFVQMRRLKAEGRSIIFITHFLDQVYEVSDTITVLRNGMFIGRYAARELPKAELISKLLGKETEALSDVRARRPDEGAEEETREAPIIEVAGLCGKSIVKPFDLDIRAGEVVGCAGLLGSGRTEVANLLFGIDNPETGTVRIDGKSVRINSPRKALLHGIGLCPEDRKEQGIIGDLSVRENIVLALQARQGWFKPLSRADQDHIADKYIRLLNIKTPSPEQPIKNLSGGNQQKAIVARWLAAKLRFLILDEPTRGIDVGAKTEMQKLVLELSEQGEMAVMFISTEIEEVARCSSKVMVMHNLELSRVLRGSDINEQTIMGAIAERYSDE